MVNQNARDYEIYMPPYPLRTAFDHRTGAVVDLQCTRLTNDAAILVTLGKEAVIRKRLIENSNETLNEEMWNRFMKRMIRIDGVLAVIQPAASIPFWIRTRYRELSPYIGMIAHYLIHIFIPEHDLQSTIEMIKLAYTNDANREYLLLVCKQYQYLKEKGYDTSYLGHPRAVDSVRIAHIPEKKKYSKIQFTFAIDGVKYGVGKARFPVTVPVMVGDDEKWETFEAYNDSSRIQDMPSFLIEMDYYNDWLANLKSPFIAAEDWYTMIQGAVLGGYLIAVHHPHPKCADKLWYASNLSEDKLNMVAKFFASTVWHFRFYDLHDAHLSLMYKQLDDAMKVRIAMETIKIRKKFERPGWLYYGYRSDVLARNKTTAE